MLHILHTTSTIFEFGLNFMFTSEFNVLILVDFLLQVRQLIIIKSFNSDITLKSLLKSWVDIMISQNKILG